MTKYSISITSDDFCNEVEAFNSITVKALLRWHHIVQTHSNIEEETKHELKTSLRGAIEGVTNLPPEHIIIDLD